MRYITGFSQGLVSVIDTTVELCSTHSIQILNTSQNFHSVFNHLINKCDQYRFETKVILTH